MIPKTIHYCWFGRGKKTELMEKCIASWKYYCPDWEIIEWNEDNFDVNFCEYTAKAYRERRWGFLPDAARCKIIYEQGGVYLDTDVELVNSIDELCQYSSWFCYSNDDQINLGSGFGAEPENWMVKKLLNHYTELNNNTSYELAPDIDTLYFKTYFPHFGRKNGPEEVYRGVLLIHNIWKYSIHHYTGTWRSPIDLFFGRFLRLLNNILPQSMVNHLRVLYRKLIRR